MVSNDKDGGADKTGLLLYIVIGTLCGALTGLLLLTMLRVCLQFLASSRRTNDDADAHESAAMRDAVGRQLVLMPVGPYPQLKQLRQLKIYCDDDAEMPCAVRQPRHRVWTTIFSTRFPKLEALYPPPAHTHTRVPFDVPYRVLIGAMSDSRVAGLPRRHAALQPVPAAPLYNDFDIVLEHFSRIFQHVMLPRNASCGTFYEVPSARAYRMLIGTCNPMHIS